MRSLGRLTAAAALAGTCAVLLGSAASAATTNGVVPTGWTYVGGAGSGTADGVVTAAPTASGAYTYVTTQGGVSGVGQVSGIGGTDGSTLTTSVFSAAVGDKLEFFFNFVTSDGAGFADYAWAQLVDVTNNSSFLLFTARTTPGGSTVPGFGLPPVGEGVTVDPSPVSIIAGGPAWSALGGSSGACYSTGCGYTGWVKSSYTISSLGNYQLKFGVSNFVDTAYETGMAIAGATIGGKPIDPEEPSPVPLPAAGWLMLAGLGGMGALSRKRKAA